MKVHRGIWVLVLAVGLVMLAGQAHALLFNLDSTMQVYSGPTGPSDPIAPFGDFGSVLIADSGSSLSLSVSLTDNFQNVGAVMLNWNAAVYGSLPTTGWSVSNAPSGASLQVAVGENVTGWAQQFDIRVLGDGVGATTYNPLTFTLSRTNTDLDPNMFMALDERNNVWTVVRVAGKDTAYGDAVPEPVTLLLLGLGLVGIPAVRRFKK